MRRWLRASLRTLADETTDDETPDDGTPDETSDATATQPPNPRDPPGPLAPVAQLIRAIESQRAIAQAAWEAYERERVVEDAILRGELDRVRRRAIRAPQADDPPTLAGGAATRISPSAG